LFIFLQAQGLEEDLQDEEKTAEELQAENDSLAEQNEELEDEVAGMYRTVLRTIFSAW
jgi:cell division protein FtsB